MITCVRVRAPFHSFSISPSLASESTLPIRVRSDSHHITLCSVALCCVPTCIPAQHTDLVRRCAPILPYHMVWSSVTYHITSHSDSKTGFILFRFSNGTDSCVDAVYGSHSVGFLNLALRFRLCPSSSCLPLCVRVSLSAWLTWVSCQPVHVVRRACRCRFDGWGLGLLVLVLGRRGLACVGSSCLWCFGLSGSPYACFHVQGLRA